MENLRRNFGRQIALRGSYTADKVALMNKYGIRSVRVTEFNALNFRRELRFNVSPSCALDAASGLDVAKKILATYPDKLVALANIDYLVLASKIRDREGTSFAGLAHGNAIGVLDRTSSRVIHHELSHKLDWATMEDFTKCFYPGDNATDEQMELFTKQRKEFAESRKLLDSWSDINPEGESVYLGKKYQHGELDSEIIPHFATRYGTKTAAEDRATVAEALMEDPAKLLRRAKDDDVLATKVATMIALYEVRSGGIMNQDYFYNLAAGSIISSKE